MTTTTFGNARFRGHDRFAPSLVETVKGFIARLMHKSPAAAEADLGYLAGRRWSDSTERDLQAHLIRNDNFFR